MDEVRRLRELAGRCLRLARSVLDEQAAEKLNELAAEAEASATQREEKLRGGWDHACEHQTWRFPITPVKASAPE
jgi:hypothetical protein